MIYIKDKMYVFNELLNNLEYRKTELKLYEIKGILFIRQKDSNETKFQIIVIFVLFCFVYGRNTYWQDVPLKI